MSLNRSRQAIIASRRDQVAALRVRGLTEAEIAARIGVSVSSVHFDIKAVESAWRERAIATIDEHKQRQLAELSEVKRSAWSDHPPQLHNILAALVQEGKLLGTEAAQRYIVTPQTWELIKVQVVEILQRNVDDPAVLERIAEEIGKIGT